MAMDLRGIAGIARSVARYHGRRHVRSLSALYGRFVRNGDLVFDIGAHVGDRTRAFRALGAHVIAVEPQPLAAGWLRLAFGDGVTVVEAAVQEVPGRLRLHVNRANPTVSTGSRAFVEAAPTHPMWRGQTWDRTLDVAATTLDLLIGEHGAPAFIKIDVEGFEDRVLAGLTRPVPALSFEFTTVQRPIAARCLEHAERLGYARFNLSLGESHALEFDAWASAREILRVVESLPEEANSGDVYARL